MFGLLVMRQFISVVNVSDWSLTVTAGGRGPGYAVLVVIVVRYTHLYINGGIMGASLIDVVLMGPTPQCSGYIW